MRMLSCLFALLLLSPAHAEQRHHLVVVSIDGLRPAIYLDPARAGVEVPNLVKLRDRGIAAERVIGVFPSVTYPSHTTLITGVRPDQHRVTGNFLPGTLQWYVNAADIHSQTLWQAARQAGLSTAIVTWPLSFGADVDWLIPENLNDDAPEFTDAIRRGASPGLFAALERKAGKFPIAKLGQQDGVQTLDAMTAAYAAQLLIDHQPDLTLIHLLEADHMQHHFGPDSAQAKAAFERIDAHIGRLLAALERAGIAATTNFVVVGDHGFSDSHTALNINRLLLDIGYANRDGEQLETRLVKFESQGGGGAFFAKPGATAQQLAEFTARLREHLALRYRGLLTFLSAQDLRELGAYPDAVAGLAVAPGYMAVTEDSLHAVFPMRNYQGMHGYHPELPAMATGLIASGPDLVPGKRLPQVRMLDIAPTLAQLLGVQLPAAQGVVIAGGLQPSPNEKSLY
jgi:predicted AlkP superfamily pyrophosphatase or phosphodiesterase